METRLGHDFSEGARAHRRRCGLVGEGGQRARLHRRLAHPFQWSAYDPSSQQGRTTLAHELTHVVQQRNGLVDGTPAPGGVCISDPSDRFERDAVATASRAMAGPIPAAVPGGVTGQVQRQAEGEEPEKLAG